MLLFIHWSI